MNIINITLGVDTQPCSSITLGRRGENEVTQVVVDFSSWVEEFGAGVITLLAMRSQDTSAYPVVLTLDGNTATWDVTSTDTAYKGSGRAEYIYTVGEQIAKSVVFGTTVLQDIGEPSETPPDPYEDWLERLTELGAETQANAEAAQQSAEDAEQSAQEAAQEAANAEGYAEQAGESASAAQSAEAASESARDEAQAAQASAESAATAASGSATAAAGSATAAASSASDASASASAASASATTASNAATAAQTAQSAAEDAAEDAQQAAQQAHVEYEQLSGEVDDLSGEVSQQKSAIEDLQDLTNRKAGMLVDSVSGAIASFVPDATIHDLLGVTVDIEPVQDLHGYDSPWPAGGGANKIAYPFAVSGSVSSNGVTYTINNDGTITANGTASALSQIDLFTAVWENTLPLAAGTYTLSGTDQSDMVVLLNIKKDNVFYVEKAARYNAPVTFDIPDDGEYRARVIVRINNGGTVNNAVFKPMLAAGSTAQPFSPYSNECPISGWDSVEVEAAGVNLFDPNGDYSLIPCYNYSGSAQSRRGKILHLPVGTYSLSVVAKQTGVEAYININIINSDGTLALFQSVVNATNLYNRTITITNGQTLAIYDQQATTATSDVKFTQFDFQLEPGSTASAYHPYAGNRYTIPLGDTIYGATLTIAEDGSVNALVDRAEIVVTDCFEVGIASTGIPYARTNIAVRAKAESTRNKNISSEYRYRVNAPSDSGWFRAVQMVIYIFDSRFTGLATANSILSSEKPQFVFELDTPITIQLDPVTISTISGQTNNVWADAGDVSVEFAADLKHYIDSKIAAAVAALS